MRIEKIDKNFIINRDTSSELKYYSLPNPLFDVYGVTYDYNQSVYTRMDLSVAKSVNPVLEYLSTYTAGGRIKFATDSKNLSITVTYTELAIMSQMAMVAQSGFTLLEETDEGEKYIGILPPRAKDENGFTASLKLSGEMKNYVLYMPLYNQVKTMSIGVDASSTVKNGAPYKDVLPILYYGSSITQGGCATRSDNAYQSMICKWNKVDFINLGFAGNGKAEPMMCEYLSKINCSLFVCDYDHNAPDSKYLKQTHYPLYKTFRQSQPLTPIIFLSRPDYYGTKDEERCYRVIRSTYNKAKKEGDNNVYFIDGRKLFKGVFNCSMSDRSHPNDLGFYLMAKAIYKTMCKIDAKFK